MVNLVMKRRDAWGIHQPAPMNEKGHEKKYILVVICGSSASAEGGLYVDIRNTAGEKQ